MPKLVKLFMTILVCSSLLVSTASFGQSASEKRRPKVGLALSGGGAKGLAHIGLLKLIDSLGIKIDYISGTSAGAIFGTLYAMGYTPDTLKKKALEINWRRVLSNKVPLHHINIEEKDEYDNYMIEFPLVAGKPRLPGALIDGQYLSEVLNTLTYPARHISDFSKLPIPVRITTSDIVNGELVMQEKGSLPLALRATMAIPGAFTPVYIDGRLLVDGGLDRNFPVQEVKDMGADVIIGGYTGFRLYKEKEMDNPMRVLYQTYAFRSVADAKEQQKLTDVFVDFTAALADYSAAEFFHDDEIIAIGEREARKYLPELIRIAEDQKKYGNEPVRTPLQDPELPILNINYQDDKGAPLKDQRMEELAASRMKLRSGKVYPVREVNEGIENLYGTQFYDKVYYTFENSADTGLNMNVRLKLGKPGVFKAAVHYDTEQSAGLMVNYTYRNVLLEKSRLLATLDLSERFKARLDYYKFLGQKNRFWLKAAFNYQALQNNSLLYRIIADNNYFNNMLTSELSLGYSIGRSSALSIGISHEEEAIKRGPNVFKRIFGEGEDIRTIYSHSNEAFQLTFRQNTLDNAYFPRRGNVLALQLKYFVNNRLTTRTPELGDANGQAIYDFLNPTDGLPGDVLRFYMTETFVKRINRQLSVQLGASWGFNSTSKYGIDGAGYLFENAKFSLGGIDPRQELAQVSFIGLKRAEFAAANFSAFGLAVQYHIGGNLYLSPQVNFGWENRGLNPFNVSFDDDYLFGYGAKLGYLSFIGPINFAVGKTNGFDRNNWRMYLSIGFKF